MMFMPGCITIPKKEDRTYETPKANLSLNHIKVDSIPNFKHAMQVSSEDWFTAKETGDAMFMFYATWLSTFGDPDKKVLEALSNLVIMWEPANWQLKNATAYNQAGRKILENLWVSGLTQSKLFIQVSAQRDKIYETSLVHELTHVAIWHTVEGSEGDADHEGSRYPGWTKKHSALIDLVNLTIANMAK